MERLVDLQVHRVERLVHRLVHRLAIRRHRLPGEADAHVALPAEVLDDRSQRVRHRGELGVVQRDREHLVDQLARLSVHGSRAQRARARHRAAVVVDAEDVPAIR